MTRDTRDAPVRILTVGVDRLIAQALRADFPHATIRRARGASVNPLPEADPPPDIVVVDVSRTDAPAQRAAARRLWGGDVLVVEVHGLQPVARVWRTVNVVEPVEMGPGFLQPFLHTSAIAGHEPQMSRSLIGLRMFAYLAILWNLTVGVHVLDMPAPSVGLTIFAFLLLLVSLAVRSQRSRRYAAGLGGR